MKILIISYYFPPYNNIGAVRVGKLAQHWLNAGHDVQVISARDQLLSSSLTLQFPQERVSYTRWFNVNSIAAMALGGRKRVVSQGYSSNKPLLNRLGKVYKTLFNFPDGQIGWWPFAVGAGDALIRGGWKPDLIYASAKPFTSLLIARRLSDKYQIPWVAEFRDLWVDNHFYEFSNWRKRIERLVEGRVLSSACVAVTVSEPLTETLRKRISAPVATILNGFDPADYFEVRDHIFPEDKLNIVYTGMVYSGKQDPSALFKALKRVHCADKVRVHFFGRYLQDIEHLVRQHGVGHLVSISNAVPYSKAIQIQMQSDVLLLLLWNDQSQRGVYTGKLFEYFGVGHPILAIGSVAGVAGDLIHERNAGIVSNDPAEIASQIEEWVSRKLVGKEQLLLPLSAREGLSREAQFARLDRFLQQQNLLR